MIHVPGLARHVVMDFLLIFVCCSPISRLILSLVATNLHACCRTYYIFRVTLYVFTQQQFVSVLFSAEADAFGKLRAVGIEGTCARFIID